MVSIVSLIIDFAAAIFLGGFLPVAVYSTFKEYLEKYFRPNDKYLNFAAASLMIAVFFVLFTANFGGAVAEVLNQNSGENSLAEDKNESSDSKVKPEKLIVKPVGSGIQVIIGNENDNNVVNGK